MAEAYLRYYTQDRIPVFSAGVEVHGLNTLTVETMREDGLDLSNHFSKSIEQLNVNEFDYVVTVCDHVLPHLPEFSLHTQLIHAPFPDPASATGDLETQKAEFRKVREMIKKFVLKFAGKEFIPDIVSAA